MSRHNTGKLLVHIKSSKIKNSYTEIAIVIGASELFKAYISSVYLTKRFKVSDHLEYA